MRNKYIEIENNEQRANLYNVDDCEVLFVAYGICSRICREVVLKLRQQNIKCGLLEPVTLYPFPKKYFKELKNVKEIVVVELSILGQMAYDVELTALELGLNVKLKKYNDMSVLPKVKDLIKLAGGDC